MSDLSINTEISFLLDGTTYNAPEDWPDIEITAEYESDKNEPNLTVEDFTFNGEAREAILAWIANGLTGGVGIFEGMPFKLNLSNNQTGTETFAAFIDFTGGYRNLIENGRVDTSIIRDNGVVHFLDQIGGTTFGVLKDQGFVKDSDYINLGYVVQKKFNLFELLMTTIVLYIMIKELRESAKRTAKAIATAVGIFSAGFTGSIGSAIYLIATAIINIVYTAIMLLAVIDLATTLFNTLVPPKREHKVIKLKRALEIICTRFGYTLDAPVALFDFVTYLPSNPRQDTKTGLGFIKKTKGTPVGIPNLLDFGYNCAEMFELARKQIDGIIDIVGNTVILRPENDPFWVQQGTWDYTEKDPLLQVFEYNTGDLFPDRVLTFVTDVQDEHTVDNYTGTSYEVKTDPISVQRERAVLLKGQDTVNFGVALGNRKDELNAIENLLLVAAKFVDALTGILGGGTNFANKITTKIGVLKVSNNYHTIPKLLYLDSNNRLPKNHRTLYSAKVLYNSFHNEKSFVSNNWKGQKKVYNNVTIPFGLEDYKKLLANPYFSFNGNTAKIITFTWSIGQDKAVISFWVREPYTINLKESFIEA